MILDHESPEEEISRLTARLTAAVDALGELYDWQNGCPLPSYTGPWTAAMQAAREVLRREAWCDDEGSAP